ncbi:molybdenum cofactor biosynthesis protein MoaE [Candidatus Bathyarchaeota archaeon]|nr:molybdenum cofactor biosynthesis protein MoaE [Candidatus Bathyarchaeota archaeon]
MNIQTGVHKKGTFSLLDLMENVKKRHDSQKIGGIGLFVGVVRGETMKEEKVQKLELEAYEEKANEVLAKICDDLKKKEGIVDVQIHHLLGEFSAGEELVYVMVAGSHRKNVFPVLEEAVERYKKEAPIFKKEYVITAKGKASAHWVAEKENY